MATIYKFVVEQKVSGGGTGRNDSAGKPAKRTPAKKGKWVSIFGGSRGGVEHNRKLRAINPLMNKATGGVWEKSMRIGRAGLGLVQRNTVTGKFHFSGVAILIIFEFLIQLLMKIHKMEILKAEKLNAQNFRQLENGVGAVHGQYKIATNYLTGRQTYNQNK